MKILVIEYVTGGGLYRQPIPDSLAIEGDRMVRALLDDLAEHPDYHLYATRDLRLPALPDAVCQWPVSMEQDPWSLWQARIDEVDAVWPIAPESGAALARLTRLIERSGKCLLGSSAPAVMLAGSKRLTSQRLQECGVRVVPTVLPARFETLAGPWVAKPDDGAGCEDTRYFDDRGALAHWLRRQDKEMTHVVQPYVA
ncbi:MAG: hypothetical protein FGM62_06400, partial [Methylobacterium sp.]|nr:hypothetical protein [Methylobacterium sp.]